MLGKLYEAKADLLDRAAEISAQTRGLTTANGVDVAGFVRRYYRHVAPEDIVGRNPVDVYGAAMSHRQLALTRPQGTAKVRVFTPSVDEHGWSSGHTVIEVVTDDMPFLVDSITAELARQDRYIHLVVHPQLFVRRDITGQLLKVCEESDVVHPPEGAILESWMHVEIDRETDREDLEQLEASLQRMLRDVRETVEDWKKMRQVALGISDELAAEPPPLPEAEVGEAWELLRWLADDHFTFLGYREYALEQNHGDVRLNAVPGTGLGILRSDQQRSTAFDKLSAAVRAKAKDRRLLVLTKANARSTVHRMAYLDYIGIKKFDERGEVVGERRILGLFTSSAYTESVARIPVLRGKAHAVLESAGFPPDSHSGKDILQILETYPRDELFQISTEDLVPIVLSVLHLQERRQLRLFLRKDDFGRFMSCLIYLPRDRYTTDVRLKMQEILKEVIGGASVDYTALVSESVLARLHCVVRMPPGKPLPEVDWAEIEQRLAEATRSWKDDFADALLEQCGEEEAARLLRKYGNAFPEAYKEDFPARTAVADIRRIEELTDDNGSLGMNLYEPYGAAPGNRRFKLYRRGTAVSLTEVLPVLQQMGVEVIDERPYSPQPRDGGRTWIYDFGLRFRGTPTGEPANLKTRFQEAFAAAWRGNAETDGFNALVLRAGLNWRQVMMLRAYAKYLRQAGTTFSQQYIERALVSNVPIAQLLVRLFETRHDPARQAAGPAEVAEGIVEEIHAALDRVESLDQDRILRSYLSLVLATLRTNYFQVTGKGEQAVPKPYLSLKFDPSAIPDLPLPRPRYEIWVYSPRVEGVHLRFGPVARGGLRWSDRREDFRTEVLGLVKAQMVKNAVIVPVGAKGGFVVKRPPADPADREAVLSQGIACYREFISGMLDITDNLVAGQVVPPARVVRHDADDTYLVVAADKGTATFSDIANSVSQDYGFWLGDAFASGGSVGYDHKAMGITARGAWESVKRHFREMGRDTQSEDFTVVGIGDMSGDVFGNGMLLSQHIRLVAAFDHRHIFLDPNPDPERSYQERERLFELPRSSWADYDLAVISAGGGVYPRSAKSIPISAEVRERLDIDPSVTRMTPPELMRAIVQAPVDLFWNGGIGTYVKASTESHAEVGDRANDAIRVDADKMRAKAVGEGGNLGFTQRGRIEFARLGGRIDTDAIDNSAGVDTSDHEVNIKILLDRIVQDGDMTVKQRNALLAEMTGEVADLVLRDNYGQNVALATAIEQAPSLLHAHARFIHFLEDHDLLKREIEFLPSDHAIRQLRAVGRGLTGPELAVLLAYTKIYLEDELLGSDLPEDPYLRNELYNYFPTALRARFREQMDQHPLRREIVVSSVVNQLVNTAGTTFLQRLSEETGASPEELARAHTVAWVVFDSGSMWGDIEKLDNIVPADVQTAMRLEARTITERATRWMVNNRRPPIDIAATIDYFHEGVARVVELLPSFLRGRERALMEQRRDPLLAAGVPDALAERLSVLAPAYAALGIVETARGLGRSVDEVTELHFAIAEQLQLGRLLERIIALPRDDRWRTMARAALRDDLHAVQASLTSEVLEATDGEAKVDDRIVAWQKQDSVVVERARRTLTEILDAEQFDLATISVGLRVVRTMLKSRH
jgi:glutamate dehydrogenase